MVSVTKHHHELKVASYSTFFLFFSILNYKLRSTLTEQEKAGSNLKKHLELVGTRKLKVEFQMKYR